MGGWKTRGAWGHKAGLRLELEEQPRPEKPAGKRAGMGGLCGRGAGSRGSSQLRPSLRSPTYCKVVPGEGMPLLQDPRRRGDLLIYFNICFPKKLTPEKKTLLRSALLS